MLGSTTAPWSTTKSARTTRTARADTTWPTSASSTSAKGERYDQRSLAVPEANRRRKGRPSHRGDRMHSVVALRRQSEAGRGVLLSLQPDRRLQLGQRPGLLLPQRRYRRLLCPPGRHHQQLLACTPQHLDL